MNSEINNKEVKSGKFVRLTFKRNADISNKEVSPSESNTEEFTVMMNPDSINRSLRLEKSENTSRKSRSKAVVLDCAPETITFSFYLDGTNVVPAQEGKSVHSQIKKFLEVVYQKDGKPVQALVIEYLPETPLTVCVNSIEINYNLFDSHGNPLRAKVSCTFTTVKDDNSKKKDVPKKPSKPSQQTSTNATSSYTCNCDEARANNQNSLQSSQDANFSTIDGQAIRV